MPRRTESPEEEKKRLEVLDSYEILDTVQEKEFDDLTRLASYICGAPIALITLIDDKRQWFKSKIGMEGFETERSHSFCQYTLWNDEILEIPNALEDDRFKENPFVLDDPEIRFYAGAPLETPDGYNLGALCVIDRIPRNLTEEQREALRTIADQVMAQLELRRQNKILELEKVRIEELAHAKESFFANMSHELRTPLNAVIGFTDVLMETNVTPQQQEYVQNILHAGQKLMLLINDVLDFSKISSGSMRLEFRPVDLKDTLQKNYAIFKLTAIEKGLQYNFSVAPDVPDYIMADSLRLSQLMMNLINNAFKFTKEGGVSVRVSVLEKNDDQVRLKFEVSDTGIGISQDKLAVIFERFSQAENDTTRNFGGTGLGLNISQSLLHLHNSELKVESQPGVGSKFYFEITYAIATGRLPATALPGKELMDGFYRVLMCEDVILNQKLVQSLLTPDRFHLRIANNGKEGLEWLKKEEFDVVLMDLQMPEMNGYEATHAIRNELKLTVPIIALTAHSLEGEMRRCLEVGMNDYLSKPFRVDMLLAKINEVTPDMSNRVPEPKTADLTYLRSISGGNRDFERSMIESFIEESTEEVGLLEKALESSDSKAVSTIAHKLKSTVPFVGLESLIPMLAELETAAHTAELSQTHYLRTELLIGQLKKQFDKLHVILDTEY